ncbi:MAG: Reeler domain-containing protein [Flavobacteriales bacterium]|nr:Reeler domain-containing protein [Flavobacteriales bacterium]
MKKIILLSLPVLTIGLYSFFDKEGTVSKYHVDGIETVDYSSNPPTGKTGAPFESTCTDCHTGDVNPAAGTIDFTVSGAAGTYYPGQMYPITISTTTGDKNGFELIAVDESETQAGSFTAGTNSGISTAGGYDYVRHTASSGVTAWTFDWTAPDSDVGDVTFYYAFNISDQGGSTANDDIYVGSMTLSLANDVGFSEHDQLEEAYKVMYNNETQEMIANYTTFDNTHILFHVQDLNGREVGRMDLGYQEPGDHQQTIELNDIRAEGIYLVSIFIGNKVLTEKVYVK